MKKILLSISILLCTVGLQRGSAQVLFTENFSSGALPAGWSNDSLGLFSTNLWLFNNPHLRAITGAGFDVNFAIFDSDESSTNDNMPELASLTTGSINITTTGTALYMELDEQFRPLGGPSTAGSARRIETTTDGGITWNTLVYDSLGLGYPNPAVHSTYNISSLLGAANLMVRFTWVGDYDWWWAIDNLKITAFSPCVAPPTAGTAIANPTVACSNTPVNLSINGNSVGVGTTYQWQSSPDGITWSNITGDTLETATVLVTAPTHFQCVVTCSGQSANTIPVPVTLSPPNQCYCISGLGGIGCPGTEQIINVSINGTTLNNSDSTCTDTLGSTLSIFSPAGSSTAVLSRGSQYVLKVTTNFPSIVSVWVDYDQLGDFGANFIEWKQITTTSTSYVTDSVILDVPWNAPGGQTRMRIRSREVGNPNDSSSACAFFGSGEAEDYTLSIDIGTPVSTITKGKVLNVVPNPASNNLTISFTNYTAENSSLKLLNLNGQVVYSENLNQQVGNYYRTLDVSNFAKGIYNLQLISKDGVTNKKVVIE